jgi:outer membrane protein TolC
MRTAALTAVALAAATAMGAGAQSGPEAGQPGALRLDEAVAMALASYPAVAAADAGVDRSVAARREAGGERYPSLHVGRGHARR